MTLQNTEHERNSTSAKFNLIENMLSTIQYFNEHNYKKRLYFLVSFLSWYILPVIRVNMLSINQFRLTRKIAV